MSDPRDRTTIEAPDTAATSDEATVAPISSETAAKNNVQLLEEELSVTKRPVVTGKLKVSTRTLTHDEVAEITLERNVLDVSRVAVGQFVDVAPKVRTDGNTTIVPIVEERLVMVKQLYLKEELHIRHSVERETVQETVPLRSQHAVVERLDAAGGVTEQDLRSQEPR